MQRDKSLDRNETKGMEINQYFINKIYGDIYLLCHATSPFIKKESIIKGLKKITNDNYDSSFSASKIQTFCWYNNKPLNYLLDNVVRTQDINPIYWETSAFYIFTNKIIKNYRRIGDNTSIIETDRLESIDIDELQDYELCCKIINNTN